jgi:transcriptional regulator with XRE-family HTH domain
MNLALKTRILASGKSQILLAREIGISEPRLSKIVGGWVEPCAELKARIASALGCSVEDLFGLRNGHERRKIGECSEKEKHGIAVS